MPPKKALKTTKKIAKKATPKVLKEHKLTTPKEGAYTAEAIQVLEGLEAVRRRPGMYIGTTGITGLHHLVWEVVDNSIDEAMAGYCNEIIVRMLPDSHIEVSDNGRGIPVETHKQFNKSALELVLTKLHAGGKFGGGGYKVSGGLHGVGGSVGNALSIYTKAIVYRDGKRWEQEYVRGKPKKNVHPVDKSSKHGTTILFQPDKTIFESINFEWGRLLEHFRQQAYLTKGVKIITKDERDSKNALTHTFYFEGGIASYVKFLNQHVEAKHENVFYVDKQQGDSKVEIALQYTNEYKENIFAFANANKDLT